MKKYLFISLLSLGLYACNCDETAPIVEEADLPEDVFVVTEVDERTGVIMDGNQIIFTFQYILIRFNKTVNPECVIPGENLILNGENFSNNSEFVVAGDSITISCGNYSCNNLSSCSVSVELKGDGQSAICSMDGDALDGDRDGKAGGFYAQEIGVSLCSNSTFKVVEVVPEMYQDSANLFKPVITFNEPVDLSTVVMDQTILLSQNGMILPLADFKANEDNTIITIEAIPLEFCDFMPDCVFQLIVRESVRSQLGKFLDGDCNGEEFGDFIKVYTIIG
ncbi:MAG TPA: hypothetical protein PKA00_02200 [Saprospiraceae bacterium]|nr:hypothetical protein [Saprospiraceae bacterium]HMQ81683.1 hypothetical protein [Saprospiraceae bacterium]